REIELAARRRFTMADPNTAFTLHKYYQHVDIVHAHGLHAATLSGLAFTGLPARFHPKVVATIESLTPRTSSRRPGPRSSGAPPPPSWAPPNPSSTTSEAGSPSSNVPNSSTRTSTST